MSLEAPNTEIINSPPTTLHADLDNDKKLDEYKQNSFAVVFR